MALSLEEVLEVCSVTDIKIHCIKIDQNHIKLSFSMIYIDFYTLLIEMRKFENQYVTLIIRE